jgi:hypothetical protein
LIKLVDFLGIVVFVTSSPLCRTKLCALEDICGPSCGFVAEALLEGRGSGVTEVDFLTLAKALMDLFLLLMVTCGEQAEGEEV